MSVGKDAVTENLEEIADVSGGIAFTYTINYNASSITDTVFAHQAYHNYIDVTPAVRIKEDKILGSEAYLEKLNERAPLYFPNIKINYSALCAAKAALMMDDYYIYCEHNNPDNISDEMWDAYCTEFNKAIRGSGLVTEDIHYFRNKLNRAPATRDELMAEKEEWKLLKIKDSLYHMYGEDGLFNTKFISNEGEGKYEGVYDKAGLLLTEENDPVNMGTYNYCSTTVSYVLHLTLDVIPYGLFGNVKGYKAGNPRNIKDFYANQEAQDAYNKIKEEMEND